MKRFAYILLLLVLGPRIALAAIGHDQHASNPCTTSVNTCSVTIPTASTVGALLVLDIAVSSNTGFTSFTTPSVCAGDSGAWTQTSGTGFPQTANSPPANQYWKLVEANDQNCSQAAAYTGTAHPITVTVRTYTGVNSTTPFVASFSQRNAAGTTNACANAGTGLTPTSTANFFIDLCELSSAGTGTFNTPTNSTLGANFIQWYSSNNSNSADVLISNSSWSSGTVGSS